MISERKNVLAEAGSSIFVFSAHCPMSIRARWPTMLLVSALLRAHLSWYLIERKCVYLFTCPILSSHLFGSGWQAKPKQFRSVVIYSSSCQAEIGFKKLISLAQVRGFVFPPQLLTCQNFQKKREGTLLTSDGTSLKEWDTAGWNETWLFYTDGNSS